MRNYIDLFESTQVSGSTVGEIDRKKLESLGKNIICTILETLGNT